MTGLKTIRPVLGAVRPALSVDAGDRDRRRWAEQPWRAWYGTAEWKALRLQVLARDHWTCRQTGVLLKGRAGEPDSPVVDHIVPHRGDRAKFFDRANLQSVTKEWHDGEKQRRERRGLA